VIGLLGLVISTDLSLVGLVSLTPGLRFTNFQTFNNLCHQYELNIIKNLEKFYLKKSTITKQNGGGHVTGSGSGPKPAVYHYCD